MSLEKSVILMELIGLVSFVMRGDLEFVGMERVEEMNLWSDIGGGWWLVGGLVWSVAEIKDEVERVMSKSRV